MVARLHSPKAFTLGWLMLLLLLVCIGNERDRERYAMAAALLLLIAYVSTHIPLLLPRELEALACFDAAITDMHGEISFVQGLTPTDSHGDPPRT